MVISRITIEVLLEFALKIILRGVSLLLVAFRETDPDAPEQNPVLNTRWLSAETSISTVPDCENGVATTKEYDRLILSLDNGCVTTKRD